MMFTGRVFGNQRGDYRVIKDPNGAAIAGASITATRSSDNRFYSTSTNDEGKYGFAGLLPGSYELRVEARGFTPTVITDVLVGYRPISLK